MTPTNEWQQFFYMNEPFTAATVAEVEFLVELLEVPEAARILDVGCGTGRHAVEFAKRGCRVTGVDISRGMLAEARKAADAAGVSVDFVRADATDMRPGGGFDAAVCLCEGAFGLIAGGEDPVGRDLAILENVRDALKPGGRFVLTALNGYRMARSHSDDDARAGRFDPVTLTELTDTELEGPDGPVSICARERGYVPTELVTMFARAGIEVEHVWGGTAGNWGRRPLELDEMELIVVAVRSAGG